MNVVTRTRTAVSRAEAAYSRGVHFAYRAIIAPHAEDEDSRRKEFILNAILAGSIVLLLALDAVIVFSSSTEGSAYRGVSIETFSGIVAVFGFFLVLSRRGFVSLASRLLIAFYFLVTTYNMYRWGFLLTGVVLGYIITILVTSILINTKWSFAVMGLAAITAHFTNDLQIRGIIPVELFWKDNLLQPENPIVYSFVLLLITTLSWLSNREIERSLERARKSEHELIKERDLLELKVEERTKELKRAQTEKIFHLHRFAEFGKLSSGIFHDLMNSLNAVMAHVDQLTPSSDIFEAKEHLLKSAAASKRMGALLVATRKQLQQADGEETFSLNKELRDAVNILRYRIERAGLTIRTKHDAELSTHGNPIKFHQVALNLIINAIDASEGRHGDRAIIHVDLAVKNNSVIFEVRDHGCGIVPDVIPKIFDPFFTTKSPAKGIGLGLSATKEIIENDFHGTIAVSSEEGAGSVFTVTLPFVRPAATEKEPDATSS